MTKSPKTGLKEVTITGFVAEIELEDGDEGVQIEAEDFEYQVVMDKKGKMLLDYLDEEVEVTGVVSKTKGVRSIKVSKFNALDDYDDDDDEDYDDDDDDYDDDDDDDYDDDAKDFDREYD